MFSILCLPLIFSFPDAGLIWFLYFRARYMICLFNCHPDFSRLLWMLDRKHWVGFWVVKTKLETVSCWTLCSNLLRVHTINIVGRGQSKDLWHLEASSQSHQNVIFSTQDKCLPCQKKQNMALAQKRVHFGGRARGFRWYLGRSPPGAWSWVFRWHSSFGWVGSSQGRRSKFYCSKVAGEEVLAFWRQPIVPHPKDRGRRGFLKRWTGIWATVACEMATIIAHTKYYWQTVRSYKRGRLIVPKNIFLSRYLKKDCPNLCRHRILMTPWDGCMDPERGKFLQSHLNATRFVFELMLSTFRLTRDLILSCHFR